MQNVIKVEDIDKNLILTWKTPIVDELLNSVNPEESLTLAFENGLYRTPSNPKINPREIIYALFVKEDCSVEFRKNIKNLIKDWVKAQSATWNSNVPPYYSVELNFIQQRL